MYGLPLNNIDIIYVGAAPGTGWQRTLLKRDFQGHIYTYDPSRILLNESLKSHVTSSRRKIESVSDLNSALSSIDRNGNKFIFIWDVRGEVSGLLPDDRDVIISEEIDNLNMIIQEEKFRKN